jgi:tRNA uridine 5-carboxymethylaminomethyl modification enzyme
MNVHNGIKLIDNLIRCAVTFTTEETHQIVMENKHLLPEYESSGDGIGPRYCPSIFKKVYFFVYYLIF